MIEIIQSKHWIEWLINIAKFAFAFVPVLFILLLIPLERRGAGFIQDRQGPNRSYFRLPYFGKIRLFGWVHNASDGLKLFFKENYAPHGVNKLLFLLAPAIPFAVVLIAPAVIPWFAPMVFTFGEEVIRISGQNVNTDVGLLLLFAISALSAYGAVLAGWASKSKYSLLGGLRTTAMIISYEVCLGISIMGILLLAGSFRLDQIIAWQDAHVWGVVAQPVAFFCFLIAMIAETGRAPFDVAEGEPELVAGFHTEYGAMQFGLFYMGEYSHIGINSILVSILFFGGYSIPFVSTSTIQSNVGISLGVLAFVFVFAILAFLHLLYRYSRYLKKSSYANKSAILREYSLYKIVGWAAAALLLAAGVISIMYFKPAYTLIDGQAVYGIGVALGTAFIQILVLLAKAVFFCWVWIWIRWTLPRFRYDHVMDLGWKVILNVAIVNLVITAFIVKLIGD